MRQPLPWQELSMMRRRFWHRPLGLASFYTDNHSLPQLPGGLFASHHVTIVLRQVTIDTFPHGAAFCENQHVQHGQGHTVFVSVDLLEFSVIRCSLDHQPGSVSRCTAEGQQCCLAARTRINMMTLHHLTEESLFMLFGSCILNFYSDACITYSLCSVICRMFRPCKVCLQLLHCG